MPGQNPAERSRKRRANEKHTEAIKTNRKLQQQKRREPPEPTVDLPPELPPEPEKKRRIIVNPPFHPYWCHPCGNDE